MGNDANERPSRRSVARRGNVRTDSPFRRQRGGSELGDFAEVPGLSSVLNAVVAGGNGVLIGVTRDGGAISVTLMAGEERHRTYASDQNELDQAFTELAEFHEKK